MALLDELDAGGGEEHEAGSLPRARGPLTTPAAAAMLAAYDNAADSNNSPAVSAMVVELVRTHHAAQSELIASHHVP